MRSANPRQRIGGVISIPLIDLTIERRQHCIYGPNYAQDVFKSVVARSGKHELGQAKLPHSAHALP
jgi:hypothetical protein